MAFICYIRKRLGTGFLLVTYCAAVRALIGCRLRQLLRLDTFAAKYCSSYPFVEQISRLLQFRPVLPNSSLLCCHISKPHLLSPYSL
jgi:hypothetical protein